jgi:hypothetical protein
MSTTQSLNLMQPHRSRFYFSGKFGTLGMQKYSETKRGGASTTLKYAIDDLSLYRFKHGDQKVTAISWRDHLTQCNPVN